MAMHWRTQNALYNWIAGQRVDLWKYQNLSVAEAKNRKTARTGQSRLVRGSAGDEAMITAKSSENRMGLPPER
jgi:hypothetical protein